MTDAVPTGNWLLYDGDCPFCSAYNRLLKLRSASGEVRLIDARKVGPEMALAFQRGFDLNEGMLLSLDGTLYYGADCLNALALMTTPVDAFNRVTSFLFRSPGRARLTYPFLKAIRSLTLLLLGRKPISPAGGE